MRVTMTWAGFAEIFVNKCLVRTPFLKVLNCHAVTVKHIKSNLSNNRKSAMSLVTLCVKTEADICVKVEAEENESEQFWAHVKKDVETEDSAGSCGLYVDHQIKDELVLGPEEMHRPCVSATLPVAANKAEKGLGRACSVRLERLLVDAERRSCRVGLHTYTLRRTREPRHYTVTASAGYQCDECGEEFRNKSVLRNHVHTHSPGPLSNSNRKNFASEPCFSKFSTKLHVLEHEKNKNAVASYMPTTIHKNSLKSHLKSLAVKNLLNCNHCSYATRIKSNLRRHLMVHAAEKPYKCCHCNYKCLQKITLQRHLMIHTGEKPFQCSICDFKCSKKDNLKTHAKIHSGVRPFKCSRCDYACSHKPHLRVHQRKHTGEKPFACEICDYRSNRKADLPVHHRTHTGERPFKCTYCDFKTSQKQHLRSHQMTHTGEKPFKCNNCDYRCSRKTHLRSHQMVHSNKPFKCSICDYKSNREVYLQNHERKHHEIYI